MTLKSQPVRAKEKHLVVQVKDKHQAQPADESFSPGSSVRHV